MAPSLQRQLCDRVLPAILRTNKAAQQKRSATRSLRTCWLCTCNCPLSAHPSVRGLQQCMQCAPLVCEPEWQESSTFNTVVGRSTNSNIPGQSNCMQSPTTRPSFKQASSTSYLEGSPLPQYYRLRRQLFHIEQLYLFGAWDVEFCSLVRGLMKC